MIDRLQLPGIGIVAAQHDLAGADLGREMADRLGREDQRVEIELLQVLGRLLLQFDLGIAVLRRDETGVVRARSIGREIAAAMRSNDL